MFQAPGHLSDQCPDPRCKPMSVEIAKNKIHLPSSVPMTVVCGLLLQSRAKASMRPAVRRALEGGVEGRAGGGAEEEAEGGAVEEAPDQELHAANILLHVANTKKFSKASMALMKAQVGWSVFPSSSVNGLVLFIYFSLTATHA